LPKKRFIQYSKGVQYLAWWSFRRRQNISFGQPNLVWYSVQWALYSSRVFMRLPHIYISKWISIHSTYVARSACLSERLANISSKTIPTAMTRRGDQKQGWGRCRRSHGSLSSRDGSTARCREELVERIEEWSDPGGRNREVGEEGLMGFTVLRQTEVVIRELVHGRFNPGCRHWVT